MSVEKRYLDPFKYIPNRPMSLVCETYLLIYQVLCLDVFNSHEAWLDISFQLDVRLGPAFDFMLNIRLV